MEKRITIRIEEETRKKLEAAAKKDGRTLSNYIRRVLEEKVSPAA